MTRTSHPDQQPPGPLIVLDQVLKKGQTNYTYYKHNGYRALKATAMQRMNPELGSIQEYKEAQHKMMMEIAESGQMELINAYLSQAPLGLKFDDLKRLVD